MSNIAEQKDVILEDLRPVSITLNDIKYVPLKDVETIANSLCAMAYSEGLRENISDHFKSIAEIRAVMIDDVIEQLQIMRSRELDRIPRNEEIDNE